MAPLGPYPVVVLVSSWGVLSGAAGGAGGAPGGGGRGVRAVCLPHGDRHRGRERHDGPGRGGPPRGHAREEASPGPVVVGPRGALPRARGRPPLARRPEFRMFGKMPAPDSRRAGTQQGTPEPE